MDFKLALVLCSTLAVSCADDSAEVACQPEGLECVGPEQTAHHFDPECSRIECCPGTTPVDFLVPVDDWYPNPDDADLPAGCTLSHGLARNTLCVACGDGVCDEDSHESWCVCPEDCPEAEHNPCAAVDAKLTQCGLPALPKGSCFPYSTCPIDCMLATTCAELADREGSTDLNLCMSECQRSGCMQVASDAWSNRDCGSCPDEGPPKDGSACGLSAHAVSCNYSRQDGSGDVVDACDCQGWKWRCL
jgi:hypothetical protein